MLDFSTFKQTPSTDFNCRKSLTPPQKQMLRVDAEGLIGILPYLAMLIRKNKIKIIAGQDCKDLLDRIPGVTKPIFNVSFLAFLAENQDKLSPEFISISTLEYHKHSIYKDQLGIEIQLSDKSKFGDWIFMIDNQADLIHLEYHQGYPDGIAKSKSNQSSHALNYLMIQDLAQIIFGESVQGRAIPRFLPFYPTRAIIRSLMEQYRAIVRVCQLLTIDGINYSPFSSEDYKSYIDAMVKK